MSLSFRNIMIPVDFTINTEFAVKNAIALADPSRSVIHLLHVQHKTDQKQTATVAGSPTIKFLQIKENIQQASDNIQVVFHLTSGGAVQQRIIKKAAEIKPDLIIIGKHNYNNWLTFLNTTNSSIIAKKTNCAVLNVRMGNVLDKIRTVVMPIRSFVPVRKMELLPALTHKQKPIIHLITGNTVDSKVFVDTYRNLSRDLHYPVNHKMITGNNYARKIMQYAINVEADLLMVNPFDETAISPFWGTQIYDLPYLKFNVLTIAPLKINQTL